MARDSTRPGCCWHIIKAAPYYGDTPNTIVMCNFWREYRQTVVAPNRPRHFRSDTINWEQFLALNDA